MQKIGGMSGILGMMPGVGKMKKQIAAAGLDDKHRAAPARHHLLDDEEGADEAGADERQPQAPRRRRAPAPTCRT